LTTDSQRPSLPPELNNAFIFATFNALSFPIVVGSPMILYAKSLGATATVLGIIAGMMPLLVIFQIPAARHVNRIGYKRFVYAGWGTRVCFIGGMALVPLAGGVLDAMTQLALLLMLLFAFNLSRGISSCAWLPWITALVPENMRGRYLTRDAACVNSACFVATLFAGFCLWDRPAGWRFALIFAFSAAMGAVSLTFLKRIPDVPPPEPPSASNTPVPWLEIASYGPFRKLLELNAAWFLAYGGMSAFTVAWLKTEAGFSEGQVLFITSAAFLGGLSSLWFLGPRLDHLGSKPVVKFCLLAWLFTLAGWVLLAGRVLTPSWPLLLALQFIMGLGTSLINMANTRLAMAVVPVMGRSHFFALYSVAGNLVLGLSPVLWGLLLDLCKGLRFQWHGFQVNPYALFFFIVLLLFVLVLGMTRRLVEPAAAHMEDLLRDMLAQSPFRNWQRFWPRG
jgi:MFS family permease